MSKSKKSLNTSQIIIKYIKSLGYNLLDTNTVKEKGITTHFFYCRKEYSPDTWLVVTEETKDTLSTTWRLI